MKYLPQLFSNNRQWAAAQRLRDPQFFARLADLQQPAHLWIGCADSRVPANEIVGLPAGELFVHRNVANLVPEDDANCLSVIQYAVDVLGVKHIIVCGHYGCGGVRAALDAPPPAPLDTWLGHLRRVRDAHAAELAALADTDARWKRLCELNVIAQVAHVARLPLMRAAWSRGQFLAVHGWIYDVQDGHLHDLEVTVAGSREGAA